MNLYRIGVVATGLLGLWLVVHVVMSSPGVFGLAFMNQNVSDGVDGSFDWLLLLLPLTAIVLSLVPGYLMVTYRRQITRAWLLPDSEPDVPEIRESVIAKLMIALFGLSFIARGVHYFLFAVGRMMSRPHSVKFLANETVIGLAYVVAGYLMFRFAAALVKRFSDEPGKTSSKTE